MPFIKLVLAVAGLLYYGLPGAILGWLAGVVINLVVRDGPRALLPGGRREIREQRQAIFMQTLFQLMGRLAKSDSHVSQAEIDHAEQFMQQLGMTADHRKQAIAFFQQGVKEDFDVDRALAEFGRVCGRSLQLRHLLLVYLINASHADGNMHPSERELLVRVAAGLGYSQQAFEQLLAMLRGQNRFEDAYRQQQRGGAGAPPRSATHTLDEAYQALGVSTDASDREVKRAYRKLISQYHPDKLIGQGVPEDMIEQATERSKEIHAAYELIEKHRKAQA